MSDIDFDELDKAVNTLMKGTGPQGSPATPTSQAVRNDPNRDMVTSTEQDESVAVAVQAPPSDDAAPVSASVTPRRRGQFMDFVPRAATSVAPAVKRQGPTLQPTTSSIDQEPEANSEDVLSQNPSHATSPATLVETEPATKEMAPAPEIASEKLSGATSEPELPESTAESEDSSAPDEYSPFISDAKVDKRPLGEPVNVSLETLEKELSAESTMTKDTPANTAAPAPAALPVELHPDVASLESDTTAGTEEPSLPGATPKVAGAEPSSSAQKPDALGAPAVAPTQVSTNSVSPAEKRVSPAPIAVDKAPQPSTVMGSIPQQYTEQPSSGDQTTGSIYDTEQYHQPLQYPEKKKSSIAMIIWIIVFGLLGVAAAAGYFFLTMR